MRRSFLVAALMFMAAPALAQNPILRIQVPQAPTLALFIPEYDSRGRLFYSVSTYSDVRYLPDPPYRSQAVFNAYDNLYSDIAAMPPVGEEPRRVEPAIDPYAALITLEVPAVADVWVEGQKLAQSGTRRQVISPPLPDGRFQYAVTVSWHDGKKQIKRQLKVPVVAGTRSLVIVTGASPTAK